jgi:hypothetical protein
MRYSFIIINCLLPACVFAATPELETIELAPVTVTSSKSRPSFNTEAARKNELTGRELTGQGLTNTVLLALMR